MLIDSHVHLNFESFNDDMNEVIERAKSEGVSKFINIGTDLKTSKETLEIANTYNDVYAAVGIHPYDADTFTLDTKKQLFEMLKQEKVVALGEIGLDYYRDITPKELQKKVFTEQLRMAAELDMPVVIHCRDAWEDVEEVIEKATNGASKGVFHCYSGDAETARRIVTTKFVISFGGNITFKNYKYTEMVAELPLEKLLVETDSPFLTPMPFRGKRNEPKNVTFVAQRLADIKGLTFEAVAQATSVNVHNMFGIAPELET